MGPRGDLSLPLAPLQAQLEAVLKEVASGIALAFGLGGPTAIEGRDAQQEPQLGF